MGSVVAHHRKGQRLALLGNIAALLEGRHFAGQALADPLDQRRIQGSAPRQEHFVAAARQHVLAVSLGNRRGGEGRQRGNEIVARQARQLALEGRQGKDLAPRGLGRRQSEVRVAHEARQHPFVDAAARGHLSILVVGEAKVTRHRLVDEAVRRPGVEGEHAVRVAGCGQIRQVRDTAQVVHRPIHPRLPVKLEIAEGDQRRPLPARRHVALAEVRVDRNPAALGHDGRLAEL